MRMSTAGNLSNLHPRFGVLSWSTINRDVTRLGGKPPQKDVAAPSNWNGNQSFLHGCFGHHAAVG